MDGLFSNFDHVIASASWVGPAKALLAAFVFGQMLAWSYEVTYRGLSYSRGFSQAVVLACMAASILVLAMQHSLLAGLGLLGVLSMIRFRANLKSPRDLVFIMGAATIGVACGVDALLTAGIGAVFFVVVVLYLHLGGFGSRARFDGVLRFRVPTTSDIEGGLESLLEEHCRRSVLLSIGEIAQGERIEHAYQVKFWAEADRDALLRRLREDLQAVDARLLLQDAAVEY